MKDLLNVPFLLQILDISEKLVQLELNNYGLWYLKKPLSDPFSQGSELPASQEFL